jgi:hypothetical protein
MPNPAPEAKPPSHPFCFPWRFIGGLPQLWSLAVSTRMAQIWSEVFDPNKHGNPMLPIPGVPDDHRWRTASLQTHRVFRVRVCSFTFTFQSLEQLQACFDFYDRKIQPSSRQHLGAEDHWECERWFERLPLFLREEPKRKKVVKALQDALKRFKIETRP